MATVKSKLWKDTLKKKNNWWPKRVEWFEQRILLQQIKKWCGNGDYRS